MKIENLVNLINTVDGYKIVKTGMTMPPLPKPNEPVTKEGTFYPNVCFDNFDNRYSYNEQQNTLTLSYSDLTASLIRQIEHLSQYIDKIIININDIKKFNEICHLLSNSNIKKLLVINIQLMKIPNRFTRLDFELLPCNVLISNSFIKDGEESDFQGDTGLDFNTWCLWLDEKDYNCVIKKLTDKTKTKIDSERKIAKKFFELYERKYKNKNTDEEKVEFVYNWCRRNIKYDGSAINEDGTIRANSECAQDSVWTFCNRRGVCAGRARLIKTMLNNRYMRVECYLTDGMHGRLEHEWNEVYFDGQRKYYDLSFGIYGAEQLLESPNSYHNITHEEAVKVLKK